MAETVEMTEAQMREKGIPKWVIERIKNVCVGRNCPLWNGACNSHKAACPIIIKPRGIGKTGYYLTLNWVFFVKRLKQEGMK